MKFFLSVLIACAMLVITRGSEEGTPNKGQVAYVHFFGKNHVNGLITFIGYSNPASVKVSVLIDSGLNNVTGMYPYHVHIAPVNEQGNCTSTLGHLDPGNFGKVTNYKCNPTTPDKCEVGDLSGKYGDLRGSRIGSIHDVQYFDKFLGWTGDNGITGRSVVIHFPNGTRMACGNITIASDITRRNTGRSIIKNSIGVNIARMDHSYGSASTASSLKVLSSSAVSSALLSIAVVGWLIGSSSLL